MMHVLSYCICTTDLTLPVSADIVMSSLIMQGESASKLPYIENDLVL